MAVGSRGRRSGGLAFVLAGLAGLSAPHAAAADGAPALSLHDRIDRANSQTPPADPKVELAVIEALKAEAARDAGLPLADRLVLAKMDAVAVAHNGDYAEAAAMMADTVARARAGGLAHDPLMVEFLETVGTMESLKGDPATGLRDLEAAVATARALPHPDLDEVGQIEGNIGYSYVKAGRQAEAIRHLRQAIDDREPGPNAQNAYLGNISTLLVALTALGDYDTALRYSRLGLERAERYLPKGHTGFIYLNLNTASIYLELGRLEEAEAYYRATMQAIRAQPSVNQGLLALLYGRLSDVLQQRGQIDEAIALAQRAVETVKDAKTSDQGLFGGVWARLGRLALDKGDSAEAIADGQRALDEYRAHKDTSELRWGAHYLIARAQLMRGEYAEALIHADQAIASLKDNVYATSPDRVDADTLRALILARMGRGDEAWRAITPVAQAMVARLNDPHIGQRQQLAFASAYRKAFGRYADVAHASGHGEEAFRAAQLASLSEISVSSMALAVRAADGTDGRLARDVQDMQEQLDHMARERNLAVDKSPEQVRVIDANISATTHRLDASLAQLRARFPRYDTLARPQAVSVEQARAALGKRQALLLPVQSDDRLLVLALTRKGLTGEASPLTYANANQAVAALRDSVDPGSVPGGGKAAALPADELHALRAAWTLGGAIFAPRVLVGLGDADELAVVGSGPLMTLPLGMLLIAPPVKGGARAQPYAIRRFAFAVRPVLGASVTPSPAGAGELFLGVGAPALGPAREWLRGGARPSSAVALLRGGTADTASLRELPSLPGSAHELELIARAIPAPGNRVLTGTEATEAALRAQALDRYGVIAFATHGLISGELRGLTEPALVLTPPPGTATSSDNDGLLTASEVAGLRLNAHWVILSACNTGAGAENGAGGYSGLARGFMQAGARNLLVSLWPVRDDVASRLTVDTVRYHARGQSQPQALRRAVLRLLDDRGADAGDPAVWAPFSLVMQ